MLSKRLTTIASMVPKNSNIIDIGCDHALLDIYLTVKKGVNCIATDINPHCIKASFQNIKKANLTDRITLIQTDGLKNIDIRNIDVAIISGMGTMTILEILNGYYIDNLIIQSNNDLEQLRKDITKKGYIIDDEIVVHDKKKLYVVIKFIKGYKKYNKVDYMIGPIIRLNNRESDSKYIKYLQIKYLNRLQKIPKKCIVKRLYLRYKLYILGKIKEKKLVLHYY